MTWDQMKDEIKNVVKLFDEVYSTFGLSYAIELSTMPDDHIGDEKDWRFAEDTLSAAITEMGKSFTVNAGRRRVLRPEAGLPSGGLAGKNVAVRHDPARHAASRAL